MTAITNYLKLRDVKQHKLTTLYFQRSEACHRSCWKDVRVLVGTVPSAGSREGSISLPFLKETAHAPYLLAPSFTHKPAALG